MKKHSLSLVFLFCMGLMTQDLHANYILNISRKNSLSPSKNKSKNGCKKRHIGFDIKLLSGYRQDNLNFYIYSDTNQPSYNNQSSVAYIWQNNLVLGLTYKDRGYLNAMGGYGYLCNNVAKFKTTYVTAGNLVINSTFTNKAGYAADWEVAGGHYINLYRRRVELAPELGYTYKRLKANNMYKEKFAAPYVGGRLNIALTKDFKVNLTGFWDYYFCVSRYDASYSYLNLSYYLNPNPYVTGGTIWAFKTGANLTYKPYKHWTFGLNWQMFHEGTKPQTVSVSNGIYSGTEYMYWNSQQIQFSTNYSF